MLLAQPVVSDHGIVAFAFCKFGRQLQLLLLAEQESQCQEPKAETSDSPCWTLHSAEGGICVACV